MFHLSYTKLIVLLEVWTQINSDRHFQRMLSLALLPRFIYAATWGDHEQGDRDFCTILLFRGLDLHHKYLYIFDHHFEIVSCNWWWQPTNYVLHPFKIEFKLTDTFNALRDQRNEPLIVHCNFCCKSKHGKDLLEVGMHRLLDALLVLLVFVLILLCILDTTVKWMHKEEFVSVALCLHMLHLRN
jgi:hypothetical protein